jgi:hypothetical protein
MSFLKRPHHIPAGFDLTTHRLLQYPRWQAETIPLEHAARATLERYNGPLNTHVCCEVCQKVRFHTIICTTCLTFPSAPKFEMQFYEAHFLALAKWQAVVWRFLLIWIATKKLCN